MQAEQFYQGKFDNASEKVEALTLKLKRFAWYRFLCFASIFLPVSVLGLQWITLFLTLAIIVGFFFLIKQNLKIEQTKKWFAAIQQISGDELKAINHDFLHFQDGEEFLDTNHFFSYDLDLFGKGSLFQYLNRTVTVGGKQTLAGWMKKPALEKSRIDSVQQAVKELATQPEWQLEFRTKGKLFEEDEAMHQEVRSWADLDLKLANPDRIKWFLRTIPGITLGGLLLSVINGNNALLVFMVLLQLLLMFHYWKTITAYFGFFARKVELLVKYQKLISFVSNHTFQSEFLKNLQVQIDDYGKADRAIAKFVSLTKELGYRQNILVGFSLNAFLLWDIRCVYKLWRWHSHYRGQLTVWLDVIAQFDALLCLANLTANRPEFVFPEIQETDFRFEATDLGHPLLKAEKRICNNLEINGWGQAVIVTGANMAGKSTFLRTVGVNLILARMGAPICATEMKLTPVSLYTNMRTTDSLLKDESYFFAELKRIKGVLDRLKNGERIFVILDEMLKGTNSVDKLTGSKALVRQLVGENAVSLIATHDLKLSEMQNEFPLHVHNKCFEIRIEANELVFDYKLSDGVTETMNATFLMQKMGIIPNQNLGH